VRVNATALVPIRRMAILRRKAKTIATPIIVDFTPKRFSGLEKQLLIMINEVVPCLRCRPAPAGRNPYFRRFVSSQS
jgi:hypothetical protein